VLSGTHHSRFINLILGTLETRRKNASFRDETTSNPRKSSALHPLAELHKARARDRNARASLESMIDSRSTWRIRAWDERGGERERGEEGEGARARVVTGYIRRAVKGQVNLASGMTLQRDDITRSRAVETGVNVPADARSNGAPISSDRSTLAESSAAEPGAGTLDSQPSNSSPFEHRCIDPTGPDIPRVLWQLLVTREASFLRNQLSRCT